MAEQRTNSRYDLVIRGATVVDGTGSAAQSADVGVKDGRIAAVGRIVQGTADRTIDADGAMVTPGFVDIHAHYDGQVAWDNRLTPSSWHGVTTTIMGNCGVGFAPVRGADHDALIELMEGVEDIPGTALHAGIPWGWETFGEYLDAIDRRFDIDVGAQVPHGAVRLYVMGKRGADREPATPNDILAMGQAVADGVRAGAFGFTTSRTRNHKTSRGEYTPSLNAEADELIGIASAMGTTGHGVLEVVSDFLDVDTEFATLRAMVEASGRPLSVSIAQSDRKPETTWRLLELLEQANADGLAITGQVPARAIGIMLGLELTLHPFMHSPTMKKLGKLPLAERVQQLRNAENKARILSEQPRDDGGPLTVRRFEGMFVLGDPPNYEPSPETGVAAIAARVERAADDLAYDLLLEDDGHALLYLPFLNYVGGNLDAARRLLSHEHTVVGLADGGAHVGTICDASFPTTMLTHWGRDRKRGDRLELAHIVERMTSAPARTVGLRDRGTLREGMRADINVIDFEHLNLRPPEIQYDLPAGGRRLVQRADGYLHTFVNGVETYANGQSTGDLPGRLMRSGQDHNNDRSTGVR